ncbi:hypothetical protein HBI56_222010 [Parastagonospora nodorum]|nr:hypothetical protein HBI09_215790 [Parastagonospora nodorum]KAH4216885.1 hypothetical protein HBI06_222220 [Parastagonospora nodorum]KAH4226145.1 hypothetical protein HBI05_223890 [Parastagonospora nodorum]KAH4335529.1 hypothetical protein HBH98_234960 [Parastagonospora nodorum]KAH4358184.1 hypothetical protein HBH97_218850 [Parastagonospora nodorum]
MDGMGFIGQVCVSRLVPSTPLQRKLPDITLCTFQNFSPNDAASAMRNLLFLAWLALSTFVLLQPTSVAHATGTNSTPWATATPGLPGRQHHQDDSTAEMLKIKRKVPTIEVHKDTSKMDQVPIHHLKNTLVKAHELLAIIGMCRPIDAFLNEFVIPRDADARIWLIMLCVQLLTWPDKDAVVDLKAMIDLPAAEGDEG